MENNENSYIEPIMLETDEKIDPAELSLYLSGSNGLTAIQSDCEYEQTDTAISISRVVLTLEIRLKVKYRKHLFQLIQRRTMNEKRNIIF